MISIIITGHGSFPEGLMSAAVLISGSHEGVYAICFSENDNTDDLRTKLLSTIDSTQGDLLILTDIAGGSPFNTAVKLRAELCDRHIEVLSGANIPMVISAVLERDGQELNEFCEDLINTAKMAVKQFKVKKPVPLPADDDDDDDDDGDGI